MRDVSQKYMLIANLIFPAFFYPFAMLLGAPLLIPIILTFEGWILSRCNPSSKLGIIILACLFANGISAIVGFVAAALFPVGVFPAMHNPDAKEFYLFVWASIPLLCILSIAIESVIYWFFKRKGYLARVLAPTIYGNIFGYVLVSLFMMNALRNNNG